MGSEALRSIEETDPVDLLFLPSTPMGMAKEMRPDLVGPES
tara:strand:- start:68 stop:190 length:123 start_codon:yes stop_codon:yes gene_type:complete